MLAIGFEAPGAPDVLRAIEIPEPVATAGQVKIAVRAATVNPSDTALRSGLTFGRYEHLTPRYIPGWDAAGVVLDAPGTRWSAGDEVVAITTPVVDGGGTYAEHILVPEAGVVAKPPSITFTDAATIPMNGLTALLALDSAAVDTSSTIADTGATGAVGGYAIQLAVRRGATVIADAREDDEELVRGLGAKHIVRRDGEFADLVRQLAPAGVDAVIDAALLRDRTTGAIRDGGVYVGLRVPAPGGGVTVERGIRAEYPIVATAVTAQGALASLMEMVAAGALSPRVARVLPATEAASAHRLVEQGGLRGRVVLTF